MKCGAWGIRCGGEGVGCVLGRGDTGVESRTPAGPAMLPMPAVSGMDANSPMPCSGATSQLLRFHILVTRMRLADWTAAMGAAGV